jgi:hypothetical protein
MIDVCFVAAYVAFGLAALCAACALRYAVRQDLRAVLDDLSGKRRAQGLEELAGARAMAARELRVGKDVRGSWQVALEDGREAQGDGDNANAGDAGATELGYAEVRTELGTCAPARPNGVASAGGQDGLTDDGEVR